jgi:co-chaperonin GroES (HSP10)
VPVSKDTEMSIHVVAQRRNITLQGKELIVIGDRVLIQIDDEEKRTEVGLYLPDSVRDKEEVIGGHIVKTGQGSPLVEPSMLLSGSWGDDAEVHVRYVPMQAKPGDYALFLRNSSIEVEFEHESYLIVPQSAILVLLRDQDEETDELM